MFWNTFKKFATECKYDCSADDLLWEPSLNSIHVARQFCHDDSSGNYDYMEQMNIDFDIALTTLTENPFDRTFWSDGSFETFFSKVEQTVEFRSIPSDAIVELSIVFGEV